jgi:hypothetical protein
MPNTRLLALGLLTALAVAGCGATPATDRVASAGGAPTASASAGTGTDKDTDAPLKFSQCMREHGMTWFPDPQPGKGMSIKIPKGMDKEKVDAAMEACKKWAPDGGDHERPNPEQLEQARKMAQCMRDNGVKNFPDPGPDGNMRLDGDKVGMGPGDPTFDKADEACSKYRPEGAMTQKREAGGGPGTGPGTVSG